MKVTTLAVTYGRKLNLGDFNSAHVEISLWAELEEGDNVAECEALLWAEAKEQVKGQLTPLKSDKEARIQSVFAGLPVEVQKAIGDNNNAN